MRSASMKCSRRDFTFLTTELLPAPTPPTMPTSGPRATERSDVLSDDKGEIDEKTGKTESRDSEQMTGLSITDAVFRTQTSLKGILMSSHRFGASRRRQTQKIGVNPGAFFRCPKTHTSMLRIGLRIVKCCNARKCSFLTTESISTGHA